MFSVQCNCSKPRIIYLVAENCSFCVAIFCFLIYSHLPKNLLMTIHDKTTLSYFLSHCFNPLFVYVFNQLFWIFCWCLFPVTRLHTNPPKVTPPATREPSVCWSQTKQTASVAQFSHTSVVTQSSQASLSVRVEVKLLITSCYEHMRKNKLN